MVNTKRKTITFIVLGVSLIIFGFLSIKTLFDLTKDFRSFESAKGVIETLGYHEVYFDPFKGKSKKYKTMVIKLKDIDTLYDVKDETFLIKNLKINDTIAIYYEDLSLPAIYKTNNLSSANDPSVPVIQIVQIVHKNEKAFISRFYLKNNNIYAFLIYAFATAFLIITALNVKKQ